LSCHQTVTKVEVQVSHYDEIGRSIQVDICQKYAILLLERAGLDDLPHAIAEQQSFTDGRIDVISDKVT